MKRLSAATRAKRVLGDLDELIARLRPSQPEVSAAGFDFDTGVTTAEFLPGSGDPVVDAAVFERQRLLGEGVRGLEKIRLGQSDSVTPDEELGPEVIVLLEGRPALLIEDGDFLPPPPEWNRLESSRSQIRSTIHRVGRVELDGHHSLDWVGTAFPAGNDVLMTNRHVAMEFSERRADAWRFQSGVRFSDCTLEVVSRQGTSRYRSGCLLTMRCSRFTSITYSHFDRAAPGLVETHSRARSRTDGRHSQAVSSSHGSLCHGGHGSDHVRRRG